MTPVKAYRITGEQLDRVVSLGSRIRGWSAVRAVALGSLMVAPLMLVGPRRGLGLGLGLLCSNIVVAAVAHWKLRRARRQHRAVFDNIRGITWH